jgi:putative iron-only hydrogenase system regulator
MEALETRVALIGIIVSSDTAVEGINACLHTYRQYIIGRMGVPYHKRGISVISIAIDAPADVINTLSGKLGMLDGVSTKTVYSI